MAVKLSTWRCRDESILCSARCNRSRRASFALLVVLTFTASCSTKSPSSKNPRLGESGPGPVTATSPPTTPPTTRAPDSGSARGQTTAPNTGQSSAPSSSATTSTSTNVPARLPVRPNPARLQVPAAQIDSSLDPLVVDPSGRIQVPDTTDTVGWWRTKKKDSPILLVGHVDSKVGPAIFYRLRKLRPGDPIMVTFDNGVVSSFRVRATERVDKDEFPTEKVYVANPGEIRLVTCGGKFNRRTGHYEDNIVVYASADFSNQARFRSVTRRAFVQFRPAFVQ